MKMKLQKRCRLSEMFEATFVKYLVYKCIHNCNMVSYICVHIKTIIDTKENKQPYIRHDQHSIHTVKFSFCCNFAL
jgi:hypothetical protein